MKRSIDPNEFRTVLGSFCSGLTLISTLVEDQPSGLICQSFFSLSIDPPLVACAVARSSTSYPSIRAKGSFSINILAEGQAGICRELGQRGTQKWSGVNWRRAPSGGLILDGSLGWLDCALKAEHPGGDHILIVGEVLNLGSTTDLPLLYFKGGYRGLAVDYIHAIDR